MSISAETVKSLREKTGAGMMECKRALQESSGDMEKAVEWLRKQGLATAAKKSTRTAAEGLIGHYVREDGNLIALVEVNCETDFVAKNPDFQKFVAEVAQLVANNPPADLDALLGQRLGSDTVKDVQTALVARVGEKIGVRRFAVKRADGSGKRLGWYIHAGSKIGVVVGFDDAANKLTQDVAKEIAMHVAAMHPLYVRRSDVPQDIIAREQDILRAQMAGEKKPPEILEKIITGRMGKYFADFCLEEQVFVKDPEGKRTVGQVLKTVDSQLKVADVVRFQVGEKI